MVVVLFLLRVVNADSVEMKDSRRRSRSPKYSGSAGAGSDWYDSNGRNSSAMGDGHEEGYRLHVADLHTKASPLVAFICGEANRSSGGQLIWSIVFGSSHNE